MKRSTLYKETAALALVFALVLAAACSNDPQEVTGKVSITKIDNPKVTDKLITGGVLLRWPPVIEAGSYEVWRSGGGQSAAVLLEDGMVQDADGICQYFDVVGFENNLKANTQYTYTVLSIPVSPAKDTGKWEKKIKTGGFPAQGSQVAAPARVELAIDYGVKSISITVTPPTTGNIPNAYLVTIGKKDGGDFSLSIPIFLNSLTRTIYANEYGWGDARQVYQLLETIGGDFYAAVTGILGQDDYYKAANAYKVEKKVEPLFGQKGLRVSDIVFILGTGTESNTVKGLYAVIYLDNTGFKPGVVYTIERTTVDNPGAYAPVALSKFDGYETDGITPRYTGIDGLTVDILGNVSLTTVYDRTLPVKKGEYQYRVKAVKDGITDFATTSPAASIPFTEYLAGAISLSVTKNIAGTEFEITPAYSGYKGVLQDGDKLAVYYVVGAGDSYINGPYVPADISFTKADLEAATIVGKKLTVPANGTTEATRKYLYVQAYMECADEKPKFIRYWSGAGTTDNKDYFDDNNQYYVQLDY